MVTNELGVDEVTPTVRVTSKDGEILGKIVGRLKFGRIERDLFMIAIGKYDHAVVTELIKSDGFDREFDPDNV